MLLIGMFDSPYVRRVAISMNVSGCPSSTATGRSARISDAETARDVFHERMVRPPEKYHEPWVARCRAEMHGALGELENKCQQRTTGQWLVDDRLTQADITGHS